MTAVLYQRVHLGGAWLTSTAGDGPATWAAVRAHRRCLVPGPFGGLVGRVTQADLPGALLDNMRRQPGLVPGLVTDLGLHASKPDLTSLPDLPKLPAYAGHYPIWRRELALTKGANLGVAAACSTGLYGLLLLADRLDKGLCQQAIAAAWDNPLHPLLLACYGNLGVSCGVTSPDPWPGAAGFAPAEGAALVVLGHTGEWRLVAGVRLADAGHETAFNDPATLRRALTDLWAACPNPDFIVVHGTGTPTGDQYEAAALADGPWADCRQVACKPVIGHCLGASGLVELLAPIMAQDPKMTSFWKISMGFSGHLAAVAVARTVSTAQSGSG